MGLIQGITAHNFLKFSKPLWAIDNPLKLHNRIRICDSRRVHSATGWTVKKEAVVFGSAEGLHQVSLAKEFQDDSEQDPLALRTWLISSSA